MLVIHKLLREGHPNVSTGGATGYRQTTLRLYVHVAVIKRNLTSLDFTKFGIVIVLNISNYAVGCK